MAARIGAWLWPAQSPLRVSARVAAIVVVVAMAVSLLSPKQAVPRMSAEERTFIQQSLNKHSAYISSQPVAGLPLPTADGAHPDGDDSGDDEANNDYVP